MTAELAPKSRVDRVGRRPAAAARVHDLTRPLGRGSLFVILAAMAFVWLLPLYTMVANSLKTQQEIAQAQYFLPPAGLAVDNYSTALDLLGRGLLNSVIVAVPATILAVFLGSWAGFFLARMRFRYSQIIFFGTTIATFLPYQVVLIPLMKMLTGLGLINTPPGLILAYVLLNAPMAMLITATFFQSFPIELEEAAALDGCGPVRFYFEVLVPVARLGIVSAAIFIFTFIWNEFLIAMAMTQGPDAQMATPVLAGMKGNYAQIWHIQMAGAMLTSLVPLAIFIFLGRYYIAGLTAGASKG